jgi:plastocyanin/mono/diheme cytochrome c family protein
MNTSKQVNVMIGLLFIFLVGTLLYFIWDTTRAEDAEERQIVVNAERGGELYAINCRLCHGINGGGSAESTMLPGAPLNLESRRPSDPGELATLQARFRDTIRCGRVGTQMPAWAEDQGGPLNDFQIEQLVTLITGAQPGLDVPDNPNEVSLRGWEWAREEADHTDLLAGQKLAEAVDEEDTTFVLTDAQGFLVDGTLRLNAAEGEAYEVVKVLDAPSSGDLVEKVTADQDELTVKSADVLFEEGDIVQVEDEVMEVLDVSGDTITVERGVRDTRAVPHDVTRTVFEPQDEITVERGAFATEAMAHDEGTQLYAGPLEPGGSITGQDGDAPCGQRGASAAQPSEPIAVEDGATLDMGDNFFEIDDTQTPTLEVTAGQELTLNLTNSGAAVHNMHVSLAGNTYESDRCETGGDEPCSDPDAIPAGADGTISFRFAEAGTFAFRCDFHPIEMTGQIVVVE